MAETHTPTKPEVSIGKKRSSVQGSSSIVIGDELIRQSSVHPNVAQEFIVTTADKVKISLIEHRVALKAQNDWITPLGILLAIVPTLVAADFKSFLGLDSSVWQAMFILGALFCVVWLISAIYLSLRLKGKSDIDYVIHELKQSSNKPKPE